MIVNNAINAFDHLGLINKRQRGHHVIPWQSWKAICGDTTEAQYKNLFDLEGYVIGVPDGTHNGYRHGPYNTKVAQIIRAFMVLSKINCACLSKAQADKIFNAVIASNDPYVRGYVSVVEGGRDAVHKWYEKEGRKILEAEARALRRFGPNAIVRWAKRAGKLVPLVAVGGALLSVSANGFEATVVQEIKDYVFFDEINAIAELPFQIGRDIGAKHPINPANREQFREALEAVP